MANHSVFTGEAGSGIVSDDRSGVYCNGGALTVSGDFSRTGGIGHAPDRDAELPEPTALKSVVPVIGPGESRSIADGVVSTGLVVISGGVLTVLSGGTAV